jgi:hypothetical protein
MPLQYFEEKTTLDQDRTKTEKRLGEDSTIHCGWSEYQLPYLHPETHGMSEHLIEVVPCRFEFRQF